MKRIGLTRNTLLCLALAAAWQARAEDAGTAEAAQSTLGTVEVHSETETSFRSRTVQVGTFRDLDQLDVPLTANVVTRPVIEAQGGTTLYDALRNTAGVTRSQLNGATYDNIDIRGLLVNNVTNYRLNGALPVVNLIDLPLENKERVEVLKGASALYYGFVPPSGVVNMVTKRAGDKPVTVVGTTVNNHGAATVHADVGRRFGDDDRFGLRLNLVGGSVDLGVDNYEGERRLAAAAFDWRAAADLSFKIDLEHIRKSVSEPPAIAVPAAANGRITLPSVPDNKTNLGGKWQKYDAEADNVLLRADYSINADWGALVEAGRAITRRDRNFSRFENYNLATGAGTLRIFFQQDGVWQNDNYRGELYGRIGTGPLTHDLSFGYTLNQRDAESLNAGATTVAQNLYGPVTIAEVGPSGAYSPFEQRIEDAGWYVFDRVSFGEAVQVMVGARGSEYENITSGYSADKVTPQVSLLWKPQRWLSVYGSYLEGLEESGTARAGLDNAGEDLPPRLSRQREVGVKAEVARGVLLQGAYFDIERPSTVIQNNRLTLNGTAEYKGFEFAASGELTRDLSLIASAIFMDARNTNRANTFTYDKIPVNVARRTGSLFLDWRVPMVRGLSLNGGLFYVGRRAVNDATQNAGQAHIPGYTLASLGARYATKVAGRGVTLQANLDNVTDKDYWSTAGNGLLGVGLPRTLKLAATVAF